ncbi:hypothetical protein [Bradyrhizobium sp. Bra78]|uniref:hypothetical protein n=1 Tax=Bradyrhizobium sp. Bra78 TaxID=2926010 RepID=UPI0021C72F74|nr:hypothetical protein [Bradyrhizobium sp. Bra78]
MTVDPGPTHRTVPLIECDVTLLSPEEGGRTTSFPAGAFSNNRYRPHIVVGDPSIRHAAVDNRGVSTEEYIGVAFSDGPHLPAIGKEMKVLLALMYFPNPMYDKLRPGVMFTLREGPKIIGYGRIERWLE